MKAQLRVLLWLSLAFAASFSSPSIAQEYPAKGKTLTITVPWAAGGGVDVAARLLQPGLQKELGIPVEVVNQPGGGSQAGLTRCMSEKPDGYTLCASSLPSTNLTYLVEGRGAPYTRQSFKPVATFGFEYGSIVVSKDSKYKTIKDLVDDAKVRPGQIRAGNAGLYTNAHIDLLNFQRVARVKFAPVYFNGGAPAITALMGGHVDIVFSTPSNYMGQVKSGDVRVLALMSPEPSPLLPGVPTMASQGFDASGFTTRTLAFQTGVPNVIVSKMEAVISKISSTDQFKSQLTRLGTDYRFMNARDTATLWKDTDDNISKLLASIKN
jgi:tripartite-type tricarboxylate transporter receptor subunit TctC